MNDIAMQAELIKIGNVKGFNIATDAAFEKMFEAKTETTFSKHDMVLINLSTIVRNVINSVDRKLVNINSKNGQELIVHQTKMDIAGLIDYFTVEYELDVTVYFNNYNKVSREKGFSRINFKIAKTERQKELAKALQTAIDTVLEEMKDAVTTIDGLLKGNYKDKAIIMTHTALDLINSYSFRELTLWESHTGKFKNKEDFHTKLNTGDSYKDFIPFNSITLNLYGDGVYLEPADRKLRSYVSKTAKKNKWNKATTVETIMRTLYADRATYDLIKLYRN